MSILQTVRTATRSKHDLMEKLIGSERLNTFSIEEYELLLSTNYIFHSNLEQNSSIFLSLEGREEQIKKINFTNRIKKVSLEIELQKLLSESVFRKVYVEESPIYFLGFSSLLGWMYVAEGSMLGSKMMYKILSQNPQISKVTTFDFFKNYAEKTSQLWKSFKELVEEECQTERDKELFLEGAEKAYMYFEKSFYKAKNILQTK